MLLLTAGAAGAAAETGRVRGSSGRSAGRAAAAGDARAVARSDADGGHDAAGKRFFRLADAAGSRRCSRVLGIPPELAPLVLIRPLSGSAALAVGTELMQRYGVDSLIGRTAAVMLGCVGDNVLYHQRLLWRRGCARDALRCPGGADRRSHGVLHGGVKRTAVFLEDASGSLCTFPDFSAIIVKLMT